MSAALSKTLKDKDMDKVFSEVPCSEDLDLQRPGQLRLFHLLVRDGEFYHKDLERWLYRNLSRYVFSRAMLEQFRQDDDLDAAIERAIQTMRENGKADEKGMGNELGEMLIYELQRGNGGKRLFFGGGSQFHTCDDAGAFAVSSHQQAGISD